MIQSFAIAPSLWLIDKKGLKFTVITGSIFQILMFLFLAFAKYDPIFFLLSAICDGLQLALYWTAFHLYFAQLTDDGNQGKEMSLNASLAGIVTIGGPALGGLIISYFGFGPLFILITILMVAAVLPLKHLPKHRDRVLVDIMEIVKAISPKKELLSMASYAGVGVGQITTSVFWPIFILPIVIGLSGVGFVGSIIGLFGSISALTVGFLVDRFGSRKILNFVSPLDSIFGLLRMFVFNIPQVFGISAVASALTESQFLSVDSLAYLRGRHSNIVAIMVQREVGLAVGRFVFLLLMGILFWFGLPLVMVFVVTALVVLASRLYPDRIK